MMKRIGSVVLLVTLWCVASSAQETTLSVTLTWDLGVRVGVEVRPWDHIGFGVDLGSTLFSLEGAFALTGDAYVAFHAFEPGNPLQVAALVGVPDWRLVFDDPLAAEISVGASAYVSYALSDAWAVFVRAGAGMPLFAESGSLVYRPTAFPFGLWPDLGAGARWSPR